MKSDYEGRKKRRNEMKKKRKKELSAIEKENGKEVGIKMRNKRKQEEGS